ncbi:sigma-70 family RNA polymerase sigma factor [Streptomyces sp. TRM 70361]|uniref:RNA polymerase sigma factor n=1 Tax=Streptomyces sp. TRM 70361 TaxID=3116553 RepID=UPI002E7BF882|nr:sigma-70 family RNA polymerase sigma factor [Streptomyces sp. TRM 70361]MEE1940823.1 sigma-70 family RNA polymerase sigma factor [Streptomyces sp. TRM 70361]
MNTSDDTPLGLDDDCPHTPEPRRRMALTFDAFHERHHGLWLRYARTQVGLRAGAEAVVDATCSHLLHNWPHALAQESVSAYAWSVLKERIQDWLDEHGREPALAETASFDAVCRGRLLPELRDEFEVLESGMSLYSAITRLPERQHDIIVLRYVLGCTDEEVAEHLGTVRATVRSQARQAKRKLAARMNLRGGEKAGER